MAEDDIGRLTKRFAELAERADRSSIWQYSKFLTIAEQAELLKLRLPVPVTLCGGIDGAERRIACFGSEALMGCEPEPPIECVRISPLNPRFSGELTHRDYLGALMALGVTRDVMGDIIVSGSEAYLFCLDQIAAYMIDELHEVGRTSVKAELSDPPESTSESGEEISIVIASERLDALIAAVWKLPREEAKALCEKGLVYVDSRLRERAGDRIDEGAAVSVRGRGRFIYVGLDRETKKGKLRVRVKKL